MHWLAHVDLVNWHITSRRRDRRTGREAFVQKNQIKGIELRCTLVDRLDASHDDRVIRVAALEPRRVDADPAPQVRGHGMELLDGLLEQLLHVGEDQHAAVPAFDCITADCREDQGLSRGRWQHDARVVVTPT